MKRIIISLLLLFSFTTLLFAVDGKFHKGRVYKWEGEVITTPMLKAYKVKCIKECMGNKTKNCVKNVNKVEKQGLSLLNAVYEKSWFLALWHYSGLKNKMVRVCPIESTKVFPPLFNGKVQKSIK